MTIRILNVADVEYRDWGHGERFADVHTPLGRIPAPTTPWPEPTIL